MVMALMLFLVAHLDDARQPEVGDSQRERGRVNQDVGGLDIPVDDAMQVSVFEGSTATLTATVTDSIGNEVSDRTIEWISGDVSRATVTQGARSTTVSALAAGAVSIAATSEGRVGQATVIIQRIPVDTIVTTTTAVSITRGGQSRITIQLRDAQGNQLFNRNVQVTSSDANVAIGSQSDATSTSITVFGANAGSATLTIRALNSVGQAEGKATTITVTVQ